MIKKIKDLFNVIKYRRKYNTIDNKYNTLLEKYTELYNKSCDIIDFDRYESLNILCEEILSKIEKE